MNKIFFAGILILFLATTLHANQSQQEHVVPFKGSLVLAGSGKTPQYIYNAFLDLCGGQQTNIIVVCEKGQKKKVAKRWQELGATSVSVMERLPRKLGDLVTLMLKTRGVWFETSVTDFRGHKLFFSLLKNVLARGGALGGAGSGAVEISKGLNGEGFDLLPKSSVTLKTLSSSQMSKAKIEGILWTIEPKTALTLFAGRRVGALGEGRVTARIAGSPNWPERSKSIKSIDAYNLGSLTPYRLDLLSWLRQAGEQGGEIFPPKSPEKPKLKRGTLMLHGGGGVKDSTFEKFIKAAGGKNALFVSIPSAGHFELGEETNSFSAGRLRNLGCKNVVELHTTDPEVADKDERFLAPLKKCTGVWIDGGRTYRFMDSYENTRVSDLLKKVLARNGIVAGSSAGCQVAGDFLLRGDPRSNKNLVFPGYTRGLGLLKGVIMDAHFLQRNRGAAFAELMKEYPQMLGIGVDAKTAIMIKGSVGTVVGSNAVSFYAQGKNKSHSAPVILHNGESYNLVKRRRQK